ncbi:putative pentatricopeptide repeat-containing protein At1g53330 [Neltuma alba]|uniref:putative pentatricopeptide repeat-containing protein At1g53330 n=1 Tax=Neltuma alba TaxID=207710 RepID=UPI0010A4C277|nr:putative pentatricopeptide repeat-containing protein At1g53330 [Prosopis alba]XP_028763853.1 putative pentatricopeptide repeat-containing protein At1g53330 [Prosopis alba]XP_028763854.1 putative pentatricopeptide repeat-containing protein At1g53330 [Prosopis alba]XP_028763855.1 putative pentatricopeptide repeat-containing protein At1g53330 [Prosopis alba]
MATSKAISPFRLCSLLRLQKDPALALELFRNPIPNHDPEKPFRYPLLSYDLIITKLGRAKMFDQMEQVLHQLKQDKRIAVPEVLFCEVISFYGRARLPARAFQTFESIPSFRCKQTIKSVNTLLKALLNCREYKKMREILSRFNEYGRPDAYTYNILINASRIGGDMEQAWAVFDEMLRNRVRPNVVTFGTLMNGLCSNGEIQEALKFKEDMTRNFKLKPNAFLYATLLKGLCQTGELSRAFSIKDEMVRNKVELDSAIYTTLIDALFKVGRKEEALVFMEEMKKSGCKPDIATYNVMISEYCREKNFEEAYKILEQAENLKPNVVSYNVIIGSLCREGKSIEANELFQDMPRRGCAPDVVSYRMLFDGLCSCMHLKEAALMLDEMIFKGYAPHSRSINEFVCRLCEKGDFQLLSAAMSSLGKGNFLNVELWKILVSMICKKEKPSESVELFDTLTVP